MALYQLSFDSLITSALCLHNHPSQFSPLNESTPLHEVPLGIDSSTEGQVLVPLILTLPRYLVTHGIPP